LRRHTYDLDSLGWTPALAAAFTPHAEAGLVAGRVGGDHRGRFVVYLERGERLAVPSGRLRRSDPHDWPAVGDWVACRLPRGDGPTVVHAVLPRTSAFWRDAADLARRDAAGLRGQVVAANVDVVLVVSSLAGDLSLRRLERYLTSAASSGARPAIVLTKTDLCDDVDDRILEVERIAPGMPIVPVSNLTGEGVDAVRALVEPKRTAVLVGSSGVGKSTLLNRLMGAELQAVGSVRSDGRGRHTTTHRELFLLPRGGLLLDTPGMRVLGLWDATDGLSETFADVERLAARCRFSDCAHAGEPGCAVQAALASGALDSSRFESHRRLQREAAFQERRDDKLARAEERRRHRVVNRELRRRYRDRPGR
jgi:ribosome biogenesis GTPase